MVARPSSAADRLAAAVAEESDTALSQLTRRAGTMAAAGLAGLESRALSYLQAGYPLHLRGPAGSGKTTLALRLAGQLAQPIVLLVGDASFDTRRLVGSEDITRTRRVVDRYIQSVTKVESQTEAVWLDRALTVACTEGCTLLYDEFNRAPADANNVLLTVLEERVLVLPKARRGENQVRVHPSFRAIFTSNPTDHVGTNAAQDALLDRMITLDLEGFDRATEILIVAARSGLSEAEAGRVVDVVRDLRASREFMQRPTLRASIMIACLAASQRLRVSADDAAFLQLCIDVLASKLKPADDGLPDAAQRQLLIRLINHFCMPHPRLGARLAQGLAA
jgi:gas vesicle protein GvpN